MFGEWEARPKHRSIGLDEGIALSLNYGRGDGLALDLCKFWLIVKEFQLAGCTGHKQKDYPLGFCWETHETGVAHCSKTFFGEHGGEGDLAQSNSTVFKKVSSGAM